MSEVKANESRVQSRLRFVHLVCHPDSTRDRGVKELAGQRADLLGVFGVEAAV
jgi:hypothetical protein